MDNQYLQNLIDETRTRGGGMILNMEGRPEVVVLMIEKYNQLISNFQVPISNQNQKNAVSEEAAQNKEMNKYKTSKILVTGGAGYIGAHTVEELINSGREVVIVDNLSCGKKENLHPAAKFYEGDLKDINFLRDIFAQENIEAVVHFAASIEVEESVREPVKYFENNVGNTVNLLNAMNEAGVKNIIFSSTAAVYGQPEKMPISETAAVKPQNPYGFSKLLAEKAIKYYCQFAGFNAVIFRYFNACGCRPDGSVLPTHHSHLIDNVMEVAAGNKPLVKIFGNDFSTFDGTGVRDYVHVQDIAKAHILGLEHFGDENFQVYNIGTGKGSSVLQIISAASEMLNKIIPMEIDPRRAGDPAELVADSGKILKAWGFKAEYSGMDYVLKTAWTQKLSSLGRKS